MSVIMPILYVLCIPLILIKGMNRRPRPAVMMKALAQHIHARVSYLVDEGFLKLVPRDVDPETASLRIALNDTGGVVIKRLGRDSQKAVRSYIIYANGVVERHIAGETLSPEDKEWCHGSLTVARLEYLLRVLNDTSLYSPQRKTSQSW